jgi:hypothetical protein
MDGVVGTPSSTPLKLNPSFGSLVSFVSLMSVFVGWMSCRLVHGSHASPIPSPSPSAWFGLATSGQLS